MMDKAKEKCVENIEVEAGKEFYNYIFIGLSIDGKTTYSYNVGTDCDGNCSTSGRSSTMQLLGEMKALERELLRNLDEVE